jgi:hypothetical protein
MLRPFRDAAQCGVAGAFGQRRPFAGDQLALEAAEQARPWPYARSPHFLRTLNAVIAASAQAGPVFASLLGRLHASAQRPLLDSQTWACNK